MSGVCPSTVVTAHTLAFVFRSASKIGFRVSDVHVSKSLFVRTPMGLDAKSKTILLICRKSIPRITGATRLLTTTKSWYLVLNLPSLTCSPDAVTSCSPGVGWIWVISIGCEITPCCTSETDDPESSIISTSVPHICPLTIAALLLTAAMVTVLGSIVDRDGFVPSKRSLCRFPEFVEGSSWRSVLSFDI